MRVAYPRTTMLLDLAALLAVVVAPGLSWGAAPGRADAWPPLPATGRELYLHACAACHGPGGSGAQASAVGLPIVPPDFTESGFASREPAGDWVGVAALGGPVRGFNRLMPAFAEALTRGEIETIVAHVHTLYEDRNWPRGEFNLPKALGTEKAYPEDEYYLQSTVATGDAGAVTNKLVIERRFGARNQLELVAPFGWHEITRPGNTAPEWAFGIGDVAVGWKRVLYHDVEVGTIASLTVEGILPTGDEADGFGKGYTVLEPFVTLGQILPMSSFLQLQTGVELPTDTDHENEGLFRVALGRTYTLRGEWGRAVSPMVEFLGGGELAGGSWTWDVMPQVHLTLNPRQHVMANVGVRLPLTRRSGRDPELMFMALWDWFDGGLLEGW